MAVEESFAKVAGKVRKELDMEMIGNSSRLGSQETCWER
jgi:hypothetical protein